MKINKTAILLTIISIFLFIGCSAETKLQGSASKGDLLFQTGMEYFNKGKYRKAIKHLSDFTMSYPFHAEIATATFTLAKSYFENGEYNLAASEYRRVAERYSESEYVEKAELMYAEALFEASPRVNLEQNKTEQALGAFKDFVSYYPKSEYLDQAEQGIKKCREKLAEKQFNAIKLYFKLHKPESVILYSDIIREEYPETSWIPKALLLKGRAYFELMEDSENALEAFKKIIDDYPDSEAAVESGEFIKKIEG